MKRIASALDLLLAIGGALLVTMSVSAIVGIWWGVGLAGVFALFASLIVGD